MLQVRLLRTHLRVRLLQGRFRFLVFRVSSTALRTSTLVLTLLSV